MCLAWLCHLATAEEQLREQRVPAEPLKESLLFRADFVLGAKIGVVDPSGHTHF